MAALSGLIAGVVAAAAGIVLMSILVGDQPPAIRRDLLLTATLSGAATVVLVALATVLIVNRVLSSSLTDLTHALRAAEKGQWLLRAGSDRQDEIGELSRAFDALSGRLTDLSVTVIDNDRELEWTRRELRLKDALALLFEVTQTIDEHADLHDLLQAIAAKVGPALGFEEMAILLREEATGRLVVCATYGFPQGSALEGTAFLPGEGVSGIVAKTGELVIIDDTAADPRYTHYQGKHAVDGAFACVPMKLRGHLTGLFHVLRPRGAPFTEPDVYLLKSLASYTALAIAQAETTARLRALAVTDELTGVANRRLLMERLEEEIERARRAAAPLSMLMVDLDHFKQVNDTHGHLRGDEVLFAVARALADHVRRVDVVARFGGEEFVVLLPETTRPAAGLLAEKLRAVVHELDVRGIRMTISIGIASYPADAASAPPLLAAADAALFAAKRAGRDCVRAYSEMLRISE